MTDVPIENVVPFNDGQVRWADSFINLLAGLGVPGRDKFASQQFTHTPLTIGELEAAFRSDWIAKKIVTIPAWDMTREWREWQADPDQIELLENLEKKLFVQQKLQQALIKARLYGGACIVIGVDAGLPEEELDPDLVMMDSLKFLHVVSRHQITAGPIIRDISSKYFGQPEWYEARNEPAPASFQQQIEPSATGADFSQRQVKVHPSRVVRLIGMDTADQMMIDIWGDSVLQPVNDAVRMCGLVTGSLATLVAELKVDVIKIPELKSILSTQAGTNKMLGRFAAANVAKSTVNTILIDGNEEWQRIQAQLAGVPETLLTYMQIAAGAADIPATRFLGMSPAGLNATGESDIRNYYDRLAAEQSTILTPTMNLLDEVIIRSALGDRPPDVWYEWASLWQLNENEKATIALQKAQAYQIDVNAAQLPPVALANARANQLIEDGFYPGLEQALEDAALEGDTIEAQNGEVELPPELEMMQAMPPPGQPGGPPPGPGQMPGQPPPPSNVMPFPKKPFGGGDSDFDDHNENHDPESGEFSESPGGAGGGTSKGDKPSKAAKVKDFLKSGKAKDAIAKAAKTHGKAALGAAVEAAINAAAGGARFLSPEVYDAVQDEVKNLASNLKVTQGTAAGLMKDAVKRLKKLRRTKDAKPNGGTDADDIDAALMKLEAALDKIASEMSDADLHDFNQCHNESGEEGGEFCGEGGSSGESGAGKVGGKGGEGNPKQNKEKAAKTGKEKHGESNLQKAGRVARKIGGAVEGAIKKAGKNLAERVKKEVGATKKEMGIPSKRPKALGERYKKEGEQLGKTATKAAKAKAKAAPKERAKENKAERKAERQTERERAKAELKRIKQQAKSEKKAGKQSEREKAKAEKKTAREEKKAGKQSEREKAKAAKKSEREKKKAGKQSEREKAKAEKKTEREKAKAEKKAKREKEKAAKKAKREKGKNEREGKKEKAGFKSKQTAPKEQKQKSGGTEKGKESKAEKSSSEPKKSSEPKESGREKAAEKAAEKNKAAQEKAERKQAEEERETAQQREAKTEAERQAAEKQLTRLESFKPPDMTQKEWEAAKSRLRQKAGR